MKLNLKLPLAFAVALTLLFLAGIFGIYRLNQAVSSFKDDVLHHVEGHKTGAEISAHFATAIQEWKNVLLRGKDPKDLEKYWNSHTKEMGEVQKLIQQLDKEVDDKSPIQADVNHIAAEMVKAQEGYKQAFEAYKAADFDFTAGDKAAKGKDRAAVEALTKLREELSKAENHATDEAIADASAATRASLLVMVLVAVVSMFGAVWLSRQITRPISKAVDLAERVAHGHLNNRIEVQGRDETAQLMQSL